MKWIAFLTTMICGLTLLAQSPLPVTSPVPITIVSNPSLGDVILGLLGLVKSWGSIGIYAGIAALLKLLVDGTKALGIFQKIPSQFQSLFVLFIGVITVGLTSLSSGATLVQAIAASIGSSGAAMLLHELLDDLLGLIKPKLEQK